MCGYYRNVTIDMQIDSYFWIKEESLNVGTKSSSVDLRLFYWKESNILGGNAVDMIWGGN